MNKMKLRHLSLLAISCILLHPGAAQAKKWTIDKEKSRVQFITRLGPHTPAVGTYKNIVGAIEYDCKNPEKARVSATIDTNTMSTGVNARDNDVKSAKYLDCVKFPLAKFSSLQIKRNKEGKFTMKGEFNLHGVKRVVDLDLQMPKIEKKILSAVATTRLDQKDYKLNFKAMHPDGVIKIDDVILIKVLIWAR